MEVMLRGKGMWKFVSSVTTQSNASPRGDEPLTESHANDRTTLAEFGEADIQNDDLAYAYIFYSMGSSCEAMVGEVTFPREAKQTGRETFQSVNYSS